jgi:hypothetical protein
MKLLDSPYICDELLGAYTVPSRERLRLFGVTPFVWLSPAAFVALHTDEVLGAKNEFLLEEYLKQFPH